MTDQEIVPIASMDNAKANQILGQSIAGRGIEMMIREDDGNLFIRRDGVLSAMRNAASWVAEQLAGFCGVFPNRELIRLLDHGEASAAEQLEAAMLLRLMNPPPPEFKGLQITIRVPEDGQVGTHTQGFNTTGNLTEALLETALKALTAEVEDFRRCPFHNRKTT